MGKPQRGRQRGLDGDGSRAGRGPAAVCVLWGLSSVHSLTQYRETCRYHLGIYNQDWPEFPFYTFLANMLASAVAIFIEGVSSYPGSLRVPNPRPRLGGVLLTRRCGGEPIATAGFVTVLLKALVLGFCGNLSTVSSFVNEIANLEAKSGPLVAYRYAVVTLAAGQLLAAAVAAPFFATQAC